MYVYNYVYVYMYIYIYIYRERDLIHKLLKLIIIMITLIITQ